MAYPRPCVDMSTSHACVPAAVTTPSIPAERVEQKMPVRELVTVTSATSTATATAAPAARKVMTQEEKEMKELEALMGM